MDEFLLELKEAGWKNIEPPQTPVTILDLERAKGCFDMELQMADMCPSCGGNCMSVGDYVCWGECYHCFKFYREEHYP